jgi:DNA-binding beta-propeller fold protein YncE
MSANVSRNGGPIGLAVSPDGTRVYVVAPESADFWDYLTVAFDMADGSEEWSATYHGPAGGTSIPAAVAVSPDSSRVFVTGTSEGRGTARDYLTVAYRASDGARAWVTRNGTPQDDYAVALGVSPDGERVYVAGTVRGYSAGADYRVIALDSSNGRKEVGFRFDSGLEDRLTEIAVSGDGSRFYVTGDGGGDFATVAYSTMSSRPLWVSQYGNPGLKDVGLAVAESAGGRVYVTGYSQNGIYSCEGEVAGSVYATVAYDLGGTELWSARYAGETKRDPDGANTVRVSPVDGAVVVSGTSDDGCRHPSDVATLSYDP